MICFNFVLFLYIFSATHLVKQVQAISVEGILGGDKAVPHEITYQVAIIRRMIETNDVTLSCSGGIVGKKLVLTIAQCFILDPVTFYNYEYFISADSINWKDEGITKFIEKIFLPAGGLYYINDIAVASLLGELDIDVNPYLSALDIPETDESFYGKRGKVSGYGYSSVLYKSIGKSSSIQRMRLKAWTDNHLRYANVSITAKINCSIGYTEIDTTNQFCGLMLNFRDWRAWGLCDKDGGSPLVINNKVVGLASKIHYDCDDTQYGSAYTKVSTYSSFINSVKFNNLFPGTVVLDSLRLTSSAVAIAPAA